MNLARGSSLRARSQLVHIHAVALHGNAAQTGVVGAEGIQGADEARGLADHHIPLVAQGFCGEVHHLLRAGGDEDVVKVAANLVLFFHISGQVLAQREVSLGQSILQHVHRALCHNAGGDFSDLFDGERFRGGVAGREGNHGRVRRILKDFANRRRLEGLHAVGNFVFHDASSFRLINSYSVYHILRITSSVGGA